MRESVAENALVAGVKRRGGEIRKVMWVGRRGAPDRRVMLPKWQGWVELKADGVELEGYQVREHKRMTDRGEIVLTLAGLFQVEMFFAQYDAGAL